MHVQYPLKIIELATYSFIPIAAELRGILKNKNLISNPEAQNIRFSYEVKVEEESLIQCGLTEQEVENWIVIGRSESGIMIIPGEIDVGKVLIQIPEGTAPCQFRLRVEVRANNEPYAIDFMDIRIKE